MSAPHQTKRTTHSLSSTSPFKLSHDRLGMLTRELVRGFESAQSWDTFVSEFRSRSYLAPELENLPHPAIKLLREWRDNGVPALTSSPPWSPETKQACIEHGCHRSAVEHAAFLREEMSEFIDNRVWVAPSRISLTFSSRQPR